VRDSRHVPRRVAQPLTMAKTRYIQVTDDDPEPLPDWEREFLENQEARENYTAALRAGHAILDAYDRGQLPIDARYLADTLRMVLAVMDYPLTAARAR
jgi:urease accessory protein UreF